MNVDMESAGALASAGLVAHEIDSQGAGPRAQAHSHGGHCANCRAALTGAYCHQCGQ